MPGPPQPTLQQRAAAKATLRATPRSLVIVQRPPAHISPPDAAPPSPGPNFRAWRREMAHIREGCCLWAGPEGRGLKRVLFTLIHFPNVPEKVEPARSFRGRAGPGAERALEWGGAWARGAWLAWEREGSERVRGGALGARSERCGRGLAPSRTDI